MALAVSVNDAEIAAIPPRDDVAFVGFFWTRDDAGEELMLNAQVDRTVHALEPNDTIEVEILPNTPDAKLRSLFNGDMGWRPSALAAVEVAVNGVTLHRTEVPERAGSGSVMVVVREVRGNVAVAVRESKEDVAGTALSTGDRVQIRLIPTATAST